MKAILTKYIPATNTKPSRIKAYTSDGNQLTVSYGSCTRDGNSDTAFMHMHAAEKLQQKMNWKGKLIGGGTPTGYAFVFTDSWIRKAAPEAKIWKYLRAFRNNAPCYYLIYEGKRTFGSDPIASTEDEEIAKHICNDRNKGL